VTPTSRDAEETTMFETSELGGTVVRGLMLRVGDLVFYGPKDEEGHKVERIWAVYRDGAPYCIKVRIESGAGWYRRRVRGALEWSPRLHTGNLYTVAEDPQIQFLPGPEGQTMADGEWGPERRGDGVSALRREAATFGTDALGGTVVRASELEATEEAATPRREAWNPVWVRI
jgi:hypothetical protein